MVSQSAIKNKILLCISRYGLKKLMNRNPIKYVTCINKLMLGCNISDNAKTMTKYNKSCMEIRDEGGLMWPTEEIVLIGGLAINFFKRLLRHNFNVLFVKLQL